MTRITGILILTLAITVSANAALRVPPGSHTETAMPRVAQWDGVFFVAWVWENTAAQRWEIWGVRVTRNLVIEEPYIQIYQGDAEDIDIAALEIAPKADKILVVFDEVSGGSSHSIQGRLVYSDNQVLDVGEISEHTTPAVASCDYYFLVAYRDDGGNWIRGRWILDDGTLLDPFPIVEGGSLPSLASDGQNFLVVYTASGQVLGKRVYPNTDPFPILDARAYGRPDVTYDMAGAKFIAAFLDAAEPTLLMTRHCTLTQALDPSVVVATDVTVDYFDVTSSEINCMLAWQKEADCDRVAAQRIDVANALVGPQEVLWEAEEPQVHDPHAASDGTYYGAVWYELGEPPSQSTVVLFDTICSYQRHFRADNLFATAYNQGRHITLDPETGWLHRVYQPTHQHGIEQHDDSALYTWSVDSGENWFPYEFVGTGFHPCVACDASSDRVWVCYRANETSVACKARLGPSDWQGHEFECPNSNSEWDNPTMSVSYDPNEDPCVYVANRANYGQLDEIVCHVVRLISGVTGPEHVSVAAGPSRDGLPSLETTPYEGSDIVSCVWPTGGPGDPDSRLMYNWRVDGEWDENPEHVSVHHDPAGTASISLYGDSVYAVWECWSDGAVWQKPRHVDPERGRWGTVRSLSPEPGPLSLFPQGSLGKITTVWEEFFAPGWEEILLNINNDRNVSLRGPTDLHVCHIASALLEQPSFAEVKVYATWTERIREEDPMFEVLFGRFTFPLEEEFGARDAPYYDCHTGDSIRSIYCRSRDGWARWRGYDIDYGQEHLRYRLTYLKPECIYKVRAVLYQAFRDVWEENMSIDGVPVGRFEYRPLEPETVWVTIPRELYRKDFGIDLDIGRISGDYATVAELKLYEVYPYLRREGKDRVLPVPEPGSRLFEVVAGNPFRTRVRVQYSVQTAQQVLVRVYDVQGRVVKDLAAGRQAAGEYALDWNGTDARGRQVAAGAYFIELRTETATRARKVIYAQ